ncbi:RagB/SusD family nutrient uptake outer membrane protein [Chitinophaga eiseniae]|uniref:RagB/SusD family nutrient uptake outer membrane protein n=1 Tax=Chitinophaga eiseniae TaxID=634771 RepID=A0A847SBS8_9BACT|nr:RagB/SusD family nutrient uptake outer membrane protein [Chitinophaga eiseniae]NLR77193.1 RagB/SusD family nutrient uptake outer membrane protein [Chitinophaga eiseniae]
MNFRYLMPLAAAVVMGTSSCVKLTEDPKGNLTTTNYFATQKDLDAAVSAIYQRLSVDGAWAFTNKSTSYFGADDLTTDKGLNKQDFREFDKLEGTSTNEGLKAQWNGPWSAIYQANNVLLNYQKVPTTDANSVDARNHSAGQAYFLRGLCYFMLVRTFGSVPIVDKQAEISVVPPRADVAHIYEFIVNDLKQATTLLPAKWSSGADVGRATSLAARALLSNVYLTMAGWPLNQTANYALAATEADAVIQAKQYTLMDDYLQVFRTNNNAESIFGIQFNVGGNAPNRSFGSTSVPLEETALDGSGGWDDFYPEVNFYLNAPKCKRTDETFYTTIKLRNADNKTYTLVNWDNPLTNARHPYYKKFRYGVGDGVQETDNTIIQIKPSTNKTTDVIRYAETLLTYAEAAAMSEGNPSAKAYSAVNEVRHRAGLPPLTPGLPAAAFRDSVVYERAYEFAGEFGQRWFDIVRLQLLPKVLAARSTTAEQNKINSNSLTNPGPRYLAPIPFGDLSLSPGWTQNPGY